MSTKEEILLGMCSVVLAMVECYKINPFLLDEDDLVDLLEEVSDVVAHWKGLGLELGLRHSTLEKIGSTQP